MTKASEAINRLQQRRQKTARDLLEAARRVIAFNGYHKTRIVDIARAANVGVGTFYLYYPTKQAIFLELVEDTVRKLRARIDEVTAQVTEPGAVVRERTLTFLGFAQENRELFRIVFGHGADFHDVVKEAQETFVRDAVENFKVGLNAGIFRPNHPDIVAQGLIGMTVQVVTWWLENQAVPLEEVAQSLMDLAFHGMAPEPADLQKQPA